MISTKRFLVAMLFLVNVTAFTAQAELHSAQNSPYSVKNPLTGHVTECVTLPSGAHAAAATTRLHKKKGVLLKIKKSSRDKKRIKRLDRSLRRSISRNAAPPLPERLVRKRAQSLNYHLAESVCSLGTQNSFSLCSGTDITQDGVVNINDLNLLIINWQSSNPFPPTADIDSNGIVNIEDLNALLVCWSVSDETESSTSSLSSSSSISTSSSVSSTSSSSSSSSASSISSSSVIMTHLPCAMIDSSNPLCDQPHEVEPWADQYGGPYSPEELLIQPAIYQKRTNPSAMIQLSYPICQYNWDGSPNPLYSASNPRGWNYFLKAKLETQGFRPALDYLMNQLFNLGFREVWFWGFAGHQKCSNVNEYFHSAMPWLQFDGWTPAMLNSWEEFVTYWSSKGVQFGLYLGSVHTPNFGSTLNPNYRWLRRTDYAYVGDTIRTAKNMGFKLVGLDAYTLGQSLLDVAPFGNPLYWAPNPPDHPQAGQPRDKGLMVDLLAYLKSRADISGMHLEIESWVPHSRAQSLAADLTVIRPTGNPSSWPTIYEFLSNAKYAPYLKQLLNPGSQVTALIMFTGWTVQEFNHAIIGLKYFGYRPMFSVYTTLGPLKCVRTNPDLPNEPLSMECINSLLAAF